MLSFDEKPHAYNRNFDFFYTESCNNRLLLYSVQYTNRSPVVYVSKHNCLPLAFENECQGPALSSIARISHFVLFQKAIFWEEPNPLCRWPTLAHKKY